MRKIWSRTRKWKQIHQTFGYLPHYQKCGRLLMEVKFVRTPDDRKFWTVLNIVTGDVEEFRHNGTPLNGSRGRLVGPVVHKKLIIRRRRILWL